MQLRPARPPPTPPGGAAALPPSAAAGRRGGGPPAGGGWVDAGSVLVVRAELRRPLAPPPPPRPGEAFQRAVICLPYVPGPPSSAAGGTAVMEDDLTGLNRFVLIIYKKCNRKCMACRKTLIYMCRKTLILASNGMRKGSSEFNSNFVIII